VKLTLFELRTLIKRALVEVAPFPGHPNTHVIAPETNAREQVGALGNKAMDTVDDEEGMPDHLREPLVDVEDCYGPVPPTAPEPYVQIDPFVSDAAPRPFSRG